MSRTRMTTLAFFRLALSPFGFSNRFRVRFVTRKPFGIFCWHLIEITGRDDVLRTRTTTLPVLLLGLSPFVIFDIDYALILCPLCKLNTLWNICIIIRRNVEHDKTMCSVQE